MLKDRFRSTIKRRRFSRKREKLHINRLLLLKRNILGYYYNLHLTQALKGLARVKTERVAGRQQVRGVQKTAY